MISWPNSVNISLQMNWRSLKCIWEIMDEFRGCPCAITTIPSVHLGWGLHNDRDRTFLSQSLERNDTISSLSIEWIGPHHLVPCLFSSKSWDNRSPTLVYDRYRGLQSNWRL